MAPHLQMVRGESHSHPYQGGELNSLFRLFRCQSLEICTISEDCFTVPLGYHRMARGGRYAMANEEEELLQLAIQQSLLEQGVEGEGDGGAGDRGGSSVGAQEVRPL